MTVWALLCLTRNGSGLPEAMKVAVRIYRLDLITITDHEACFRLVSGLEAFSLIPLLGLDRDPLDIMLGCHRMLYGSYLDTYLVLLNGINRYVLLLGRILCSRASFVPGMISFIFSPQHTTGTPLSLTMAIMLPQWVQMKNLCSILILRTKNCIHL